MVPPKVELIRNSLLWPEKAWQTSAVSRYKSDEELKPPTFPALSPKLLECYNFLSLQGGTFKNHYSVQILGDVAQGKCAGVE